MGFLGNTSSNEDDLFGSHPGAAGPSLFTDPGKFTGVLNAYKPLYQQALATDGDPVQGIAQSKMVNMSGGGQKERPSGNTQETAVTSLTAQGEKPFGENDRIREKKRQLEQGTVREGEAGPMNEPYDPEGVAVRGRGGYHLSPELKDRLRSELNETRFKDMDLDSLKLYRGRTPWYMPGDKQAITLENHIYHNDPNFDPENNPEHFKILVEEVVHSGQFQDDMTRPGYLWESLLKGYKDNKWEKQAKEIAKIDNETEAGPSYNEPPAHQPIEEKNISE